MIGRPVLQPAHEPSQQLVSGVASAVGVVTEDVIVDSGRGGDY